MERGKSRAAGTAFLMVCAAACAQTGARLIAVPPPPMGWSSWNSFSNTVDSENVMEQARAMARNGMKQAGYQYINIDEGWWLGKRDAKGNIVVDEGRWPAIAEGERAGDMANIVRFIHGLGLKAGIYTDAGRDGCSMYPDIGPKIFGAGSEGHYEQDFLEFARWGFDYVKVDWCGGDKENLDPAVQYAAIARAIARAEKLTGHRLYLSLCEWGKQSPWTWAPHVGGAPADVWRTSGDIVDPVVLGGPHADRKASFEKMLANFDQGIHPEAEHTGFYNDPDMMVAGMPGLTDAQNRVHISLWAMSGAPLLVGADLTKLSAATLAMLTNEQVLAVDQDPLGLQAVLASEPAKGLQVWSKALAAPGTRAVLVLNRTHAAAEIPVTWKDLGLAEGEARFRDLWTGEELSSQGSYAVRVPAEDAVLARVTGREPAGKRYLPQSASKTAADHPELCQGCAKEFMGVAGLGKWARLRISYVNPDKAARFAALSVNEQGRTVVAFPPTGAAAGNVEVQVMLDAPGSSNTVTFFKVEEAMPVLQAVTVE